MVTSEARNVAREIESALDTRDIQPATIGVLAAAGAAGAIIAQEVAERVLVLLDRPRDPTQASDLGISVLAKAGFAVLWVAVGAAAGLTSGLGLIVVGVGGLGALVSAGVDFFDMLQRGGLPGQMPTTGSQGRNRQPSRPSPSPSPAQPQDAATDGGREDYGAYGD